LAVKIDEADPEETVLTGAPDGEVRALATQVLG
jgi:hypothetical protein